MNDLGLIIRKIEALDKRLEKLEQLLETYVLPPKCEDCGARFRGYHSCEQMQMRAAEDAARKRQQQ